MSVLPDKEGNHHYRYVCPSFRIMGVSGTSGVYSNMFDMLYMQAATK